MNVITNKENEYYVFKNHRNILYDYEQGFKVSKSNRIKLAKFLKINGTRWNARDMGEVLVKAFERYEEEHEIIQNEKDYRWQNFFLNINDYEKIMDRVAKMVMKKEDVINMVLEIYLDEVLMEVTENENE